jgi:hypothetical protein
VIENALREKDLFLVLEEFTAPSLEKRAENKKQGG